MPSGGEGRPPEFGEQPPKAVLDQPVLVDRREDGTYHKGVVTSCNEDGTYDVTFADDDLQQNVPRYLLRPRSKEDLAAEAEELRRAELLEKLQRSMKVTTLTSKFIKKTQVAALTTRQRVEAPVPAAAVAWLRRGTVQEFESSPGKWRAFCQNCGSPLYSRRAARPEVHQEEREDKR